MAMNTCFLVIIFFLYVRTGLGSSNFISENLFDSFVLESRRSLLQVKKDCPVGFENMNFTGITSQCKIPYNTTACCKVLKEFACPYKEYIDDADNNCATIMFSYISIKGKYPGGLFANFCGEGKDGNLECPASAPPPSENANANANGIDMDGAHLPVLLTLAAQLAFLFYIF